MLSIEAVTVCVGYADFLAETARANRKFFTRWVIVTTPEDVETQKVCHLHNLRILMTNDIKRNGKVKVDDKIFNKGRGIQRGFEFLSCKDWVLHIDADIVLPPEFPHALDMACLEEDKIYGCDRQMVVGWDNWQKIKSSGYQQQGLHCYVNPHWGVPVGTRWASPQDGYVPIGFFQLMHGSNLTREKEGIWIRPYPDHHAHAARSDVQFGLTWDKNKRECIQEFLVFHLESEPAQVGKNWNGRTSAPWGPAGTTTRSPS